MKSRDISKLHHLKVSELLEKLTLFKQDLVMARLNAKVGQEKDVHEVKKLRRSIAVVKTILREKKLEEELRNKVKIKIDEKINVGKTSENSNKENKKDVEKDNNLRKKAKNGKKVRKIV